MSLSVGNQVSGPVGRPLSISVLLAVQLGVPRRVALSRALSLSLSSSLSRRPRCVRLFSAGSADRLCRRDRPETLRKCATSRPSRVEMGTIRSQEFRCETISRGKGTSRDNDDRRLLRAEHAWPCCRRVVKTEVTTMQAVRRLALEAEKRSVTWLLF